MDTYFSEPTREIAIEQECTCTRCKATIPIGADCIFDPKAEAYYHEECWEADRLNEMGAADDR